MAASLVATLANPTLAGALGRWLAGHVADARLLAWVSGGAFFAFGHSVLRVAEALFIATGAWTLLSPRATTVLARGL